MFPNIIFLDGVACVGKTTLIKGASKKVNKIYLDYYERCQENSLYLSKASNSSIQTLYTLTFLNNLSKIKEPTICDRSPLTDIWYYDINQKIAANKPRLNFVDLYSTYKTIFIIPSLSHAHDILKQMKKRNNGIDCMSLEYVYDQILYFRELQNLFNEHSIFSSYFINIPSHIDMFSDSYFCYIETEVDKIIQYELFSNESSC